MRGRFLVGSRPVGDDLVRRFMSSAAASGIDVFRLHDPLNDVGQPAASRPRRSLRRGPRVRRRPPLRQRAATTRCSRPRGGCRSIGAARILLDDPAGLLQPHRAGELVAELRELTGLPVGLYCQGAGRNALALALEARARGRRPDRLRRLPGRARDAPDLGGVARARRSPASGTTRASTSSALWRAADLVDEHIGDMPITPLLPRISVRAARRKLPLGLVAAIDDAAARAAARATGSTRCSTSSSASGVEAGSPPLAAPLGQIVASQALVNVLGANRYGHDRRRAARARERAASGRTPAPIDPALERAVELLGPSRRRRRSSTSTRCARGREGLAASEEELLLLALFGDEAEPLLRSIRQRAGGEETVPETGTGARSRRADPRGRPDRPGDGHRRDHGRGGRDAGQRPPHRRRSRVAVTAEPSRTRWTRRSSRPPATGSSRIESPMVGTFYRAPSPEAPPFVEEGDPVSAGQVLCILEAMKLMNEVKAEIEGIVRRIHVADAEPVEYGQLLFELEPLNGRPLGSDTVFRRVLVANRGRDRRPRDPRAARARRRGGRRLLDRRRATRCTSASPTRPSASARPRPPRATCASRRSSPPR